METDMTTVVYRRVHIYPDVPACREDEELYSSLVFGGKDGKTDDKHHDQCKMAALFLALLCAVIVGLIIVMADNRQQLQDCQTSQANLSVSAREREALDHELQQRFRNVTKEKSEVEVRYNQLQEEKSQLQVRINQLQNEKSQLDAKCSATADERDKLQRQITRLETMMTIKKHAVNVDLDPDTAHPNLVVSRDGKIVWLSGERQILPNIPKRFNAVPCILAKAGISSGKAYYEVQVTQKMCWDIGLAKESINRKGMISYMTKNGYWIVMRRENKYYAPETHAVPLYLKVKPEKVGVFVDYEAGLVSFYDADSWHHIHSYTSASFSETLYPFLSTCAIVNEVALIISPVKSIHS